MCGRIFLGFGETGGSWLSNQMRAEYRFDYKKAKPNRFATQMSTGRV
jgi:hypothetical protein